MTTDFLKRVYVVRLVTHAAIAFAAALLIGGLGTVLYKNVLNPHDSLQENEFGVTVNTPDPFGWVTEVAERAAVTGAVILIVILGVYFFFWFHAQRRS